MLTDADIDRLIAPIINRQRQINSYALEQIAERIKQIGNILPSDVQKLISMRNAGADAKKLIKELAKMSEVQAREIKKLIREVATSAYEEAKPLYDYRHKTFIPYGENENLQRQVEAMARQTSRTYLNLSKAQGFMLRNLEDPTKLVPTPMAKAYQSVVDEAVQTVSSGVTNYSAAMRRTMSQLVESGIRRVVYVSEKGRHHTQRMDTAVRRNLLDGVRAINQKVQDIIGEEIGSDGVEISVHMNPAPDHEEMQGHQYTREEFNKMQNSENFKDIQGRDYTGFDRAVGTLNCRHFAYSIIIGVQRQNYTDEQLKEILKKNKKGYTLPNGKHLTMYECTQEQRRMETDIRKYKDGQMAALKAGDTELANKYQAKIGEKTREYRAFSKACGLSVKLEKMNVPGYRAIK